MPENYTVSISISNGSESGNRKLEIEGCSKYNLVFLEAWAAAAIKQGAKTTDNSDPELAKDILDLSRINSPESDGGK